MANYKLKYSGEKIDEILTKADGMVEVGTANGETAGKVKLSDAINETSDASAGIAATPKAVKDAYDATVAANETVDALSKKVEKNTGSISKNNEAVNQLKTDMDTKANKTDVLSLEEIQASTYLTGKIASASSVKSIDTRLSNLNSYAINSGAKTNIKLSGFGFNTINIFYFGSFNTSTGYITGHFYRSSEAITENDVYKFSNGTLSKVTATVSSDNNSITIPIYSSWCIGTLMTNVPVTIKYV